MKERATLGEMINDLTERVTIAERVATAKRAALAERDALVKRRVMAERRVIAERHAWLGIPILIVRVSLIPFLFPMGVALTAISGAIVATGIADWNQRDVSYERVGLAQKVAFAEKVTLAEKAKLEEAVAKLKATSGNLKFEIPNINGAFV